MVPHSMDVLLGHAQSQAASHALLLADAVFGATSSAAAGLYTYTVGGQDWCYWVFGHVH